jgi:hypothetical protein
METEEIKSPGRMLADEMYSPAPVVEKQEDPVIEAEDLVEQPVEDVEDVDGVAEPSNNEDEDGDSIVSLAQLAEHLETDDDFLKGLKTTQKVNGKDVEFSISEAIDTHMKVSAADDYLSDAKMQAKSIIEQAEQEKGSVVATGAVFAKLLSDIEKEFQSEKVDWDKLRREDPAEYAAKREETRDKKERLDEIKRQAVEQLEKGTADSENIRMHQLEADLPRNKEILLDRIPDWKDAKKAAEEQPEVFKYLKNDFSPEEIKLASYNGKLLALAIKAMRYDQSKTKSDAAKKKVTKIPKMLKPGPKKDEGNASHDQNDRVALLYGS